MPKKRTGDTSIKYGDHSGSQNETGLKISIGGQTYAFKENRDSRKMSSKQSESSLESSGHQPSIFMGTSHGHPPVTSPARGVYYVPSEKPSHNQQTIRALNSAPTLSGFQNAYYRNSNAAFPHGSRHRSKMKSSTLAGDLCQVFSVFFAILVRIVLAVFTILTVMVVVDKRNDERFWALTSILSLMLVEGVYTVVKRRGQERKWVSLCFVCYLLACLPSVWLLELQKLGLFESKYANASGTTSELYLPGGITTSLVLASDDIIFILENCMVFLLILCRWLLPRGDISRDQLSQLLFVFIGMGSDVMELFQLFEAEEVKKRRTLTCIILAVWSLSLFQFTMVLTMSANPKKARVALDPTDDTQGVNGIGSPHRSITGLDNIYRGPGGKSRQKRTFKDFLIRSEVWSLIVTIFMQDGPYLAVRLYVVIELDILDSTIVFFICKNAIVVCLLFYRLIVVGLRLSEDNDDDSDDGMDLFFKDYVVSALARGGHSPEKKVRLSTADGRSAVTDMTTLTPVSTNTRKARQKTAHSIESNDSTVDGKAVKNDHAPSFKEAGAEPSGSAHPREDEKTVKKDPTPSSNETGAQANDSAHSIADAKNESTPAFKEDGIGTNNSEDKILY
ncbi:hypothetical protein EGW08_022672 [Elysia chlorotica]|uniref:Transmembrane protein 26 n=1 Tax=Elysia chlorotica TaxID=188477 RepID=A0A433SKC2_ELYCH|nr:hypothetical protein EGW08_022672 [Elysia chlorotica]